MRQALKRAYGESWQFMKTFPLLVGLIIVPEGAQHVVEWLSGFYDSFEAMREAGSNPLRLLFGAAKYLSILVITYWVARYLLSNGSIRFTLASDTTAVRRFGIAAFCYVLIVLITAAVLLIAVIAGKKLANNVVVLLVVLMAGILVRTLLALWLTGTAVAAPEATLANSIRSTRGSLLWGMAFLFLGSVPPMMLHYAIGYGAVGQSKPIVAILLALDTALVGYMGVLYASLLVQIARRINISMGYTG